MEAPREDDQPDRSPPIFDLLLDSQHVEEGETAKFMVKVSGNPRPVLKWSINDSIVCNVRVVYGKFCNYSATDSTVFFLTSFDRIIKLI